MVMKLLEHYIKGKKENQDLSEDLFVFNDHFAAVIDGATNVSGGMYGNKTPGRIAAETIQACIEKLPPEVSLSDMIETVTWKMQEAHHTYKMKEAIEKDRWKAPTASVVLYSRFYQEVWQIGDCQLMIDGKLYLNEKYVDKITAEARAMYLEAELNQGKTVDELLENDTGWQFVQPLIRQQHYLQNAPDNQYGFEVFNGFPVDMSKIKVTRVPKTARQIVLASDGYPFLEATLQESEDKLARLLKEDPLCFRKYKLAKGLMKGNHSFDDRTYLRMEL